MLSQLELDLLSQYAQNIEVTGGFNKVQYTRFRLDTNDIVYEITLCQLTFLELEKTVYTQDTNSDLKCGKSAYYNNYNSTITTLHDALMFVELDRV